MDVTQGLEDKIHHHCNVFPRNYLSSTAVDKTSGMLIH